MNNSGKKYICVFGVGVLSQYTWKQILLALPGQPDFICDNSPEKWGANFFGLECVSPEKLKSYAPDVTVYIAVKHYEPITRQLQKLEISDIYNIIYSRKYHSLSAVKSSKEYLHPPTVSTLNLKGKLALVTGASRGVGREITIQLMKLGANIIAHSRKVEHLKNLKKQAARYKVNIKCIAAELDKTRDIEKFTKKLTEYSPAIDIVYNNAGISPPFNYESVWDIPSSDFIKAYTVNAVAPIKICQKIIPFMIKKGFGRIINLSSSIEQRPMEGAYACSKAALDKYIYDITPTLQGSGVIITQLDPGWLKTDMGGSDAPSEITTALPGALLGAVLDEGIQGKWIFAQDYSGMELKDAAARAAYLLN